MFEFPSLCRFCTRKTPLMYDLDDGSSSLIGKLATLAPDTVEFNQLLPQKICQYCYDKLNDTYSFQQQIYRAFHLYKRFIEYQRTLENNEVEGIKTEPFEYLVEDFMTDEFRQFLNNFSSTPSVIQLNETFIKQPAARKQENVVVKRKRGRPKKYSGLMKFKNDDLTDVEKMKNVVVNAVPNIDPDYEPEGYFEQPPLMINLHKKRGRPKSHTKPEKETNETFIVTEARNEPGTSRQDAKVAKGKNKKITRIGAIQSDLDPHEYTYTLPYDPQVTITYISNAADKFFFCKSCTKQYCDFSSLRKHFVHHSAIKIFHCQLCDYKTFTKHCLDTHQIVHADARPEACPVCGKTFKSKDRLHRHTYCHTKRFICDVCGKEFSHSAMLKKHVQHVHVNERNFFCSECGYAAKCQDYLKRHMTRHDDTDDKKIQCTVCKKLLKTRNSFKVHMKRHKDDRKFACSSCDKTYVLKSQLDVHVRTHTGVKPFTCRFCGKQFRKVDPFKNHLRIHTNEKPFVCRYCSRKFTQKVSLQVHLRLHTGERPYKCGL